MTATDIATMQCPLAGASGRAQGRRVGPWIDEHEFRLRQRPALRLPPPGGELQALHDTLLSAGGNDLKNLFAELYQALGDQKLGIKVMGNAVQLKSLESGQLLDDFFDDVLNSIKAFIGLRDAAGSARTRAAPLIMHGYDYLQPRPAPAKTLLGRSWARDLGCIPPASMPV